MTRHYVAYLAVLPAYRQQCVDALLADMRERGDEVELVASEAHLDETVRTGIDRAQYTRAGITRLGEAGFVQWGSWGHALVADTTILDLNPRSVTAWGLLLARRTLGRRTLVWGHLHPRAGAESMTARLRRGMRNLADGVITYTHTQAREAAEETPDQPVWVAPNALYRRDLLAPGSDQGERDTILYVGRLERAKKVHLLVPAFAEHARDVLGTRLVVVGSGSLAGEISAQARSLGVADRVELLGQITDAERLGSLYRRAFCSVSPGFAGLGLTQSLGFGVPQVISADEPHSPEIELAEGEAVEWFDTDSVDSLAKALTLMSERRQALPLTQVQERVRREYSAEAMADGLAAALAGR
ncbi:MAG: glycosyltransferase [Nocardioides sp.]|nr:glycosyltransferase [Nocardioides sp.]